MDELQVKIVSIETIRPATPTPPELKCYKLSLLDQLSPLVYGIGFTCYGPPNKKLDDDHSVVTIGRLKESLSEALSVFYPLAGKLNGDESSIDCNDQGIPFVEAHCKFPLSLFLLAPSRVDMVHHFLPSIIPDITGRSSLAPNEMVPFALQVSMFDCGGVIIGVKGLHKILDAASCAVFLNIWSDLAKAQKVDNIDITSAISVFPPCSWAAVSPPRSPLPIWALEGNKVDGTCVVKVFKFNPHSVSTLQAKAKSDLAPNPTRVEAVSGFIWKHVMAAAATASGNPCAFGPSVVTHAVNIRSRTSPKLSPTTFGNLVIHGIANYEGQSDGDEPELSGLVSKIWRALADVKDADFLSKLQGKDGGEVIREYKQKIADLKDVACKSTYRFTSWSRLGMNPDFGLGMPVWSGHSGGRMSSSFRNLIHLILNPCQGIEVWFILDENEMLHLQSDPNFLQFASLLG